MFLVTGVSGELGSELRKLLGERAVYAGKSKLDIADESAVSAFFVAEDFETAINCAAYTAVDRAEGEPDAADRINRHGAALPARYLQRIIQISTDYVFDGTAHLPYRESDALILFLCTGVQNWLAKRLFWQRQERPSSFGQHGCIQGLGQIL